ncbi:uncharacterized protein K02A2.6-like [Mercenaria mercenaria]|uniref:uncharacterized protein K02A2.6-like n=1 Tax=Mercenaria mercenaria TaxID=6596 RepID=UPI00234F6D3C|nr:uncharacterized protein K02A2.6-like [Mercenaria mercenaria]
MVGQDGIAVDPDKVKAIRDLAPPKDVHSVRSFMGMVTQLGKFSPLLAEYSEPIRDLLSSEITVNNGLLMRNDRLIIPSELKTDILARLHEAHQGINKCRSRAKESVWWLGISKDIENLVKGCDTCAKMQNEKREQLIATPFPDRCWSKLGSDLFQWRGCTYLLVIDYYSRYIEIAKLSSLSSATVVAHLKSILSRHGLCDIIVTDGGPQYASDTFNKFCADYGIEHITSSPRYPMGNSEAERAVQTVKRPLNACDDPYLAMLQNGLSPSQLLFGRQIKTTLPQAPQKLDPKPVNSREIQQKEKNYRNYSKEITTGLDALSTFLH